MKSRTDPNMQLVFLVEAAEAFDGFVMGVGSANDYMSFSRQADINLFNSDTWKSKTQTDAVKDFNKEKDNIRKYIMTKIIDNASGAFYTKDILKNPFVFIRDTDDTKYSLNKYLTFLIEPGIDSIDPTFNVGCLLSDGDAKTTNPNPLLKSKIGSMSKMVVEHDIVANVNGETPNSSVTSDPVVSSPEEEEKMVVSSGSQDEGHFNAGSSIMNPTISAPTLTACIIRDHALGYTARRKDFLSLFFNAITPLEMARCTPYISLTFFHQNFASHDDYYLNPVGYMKFYGTIDENGKLKPAEDASGSELFDNTTFPYDERKPTGGDDINTDVGYMSMFTSPQTMVNADINSTPGKFATIPKSPGSAASNALEPFAPEASLKSVTVATTSGGFGLTSSREGTISLTIHDRSRLHHFAPIISLNQLANSSVRIEFGWSHPDSKIMSDNIIGKFLDSMKDVNHYTILSSDLSLKGSSVDVTMKIHSMGQQHIEHVPACCGKLSPMKIAGKAIQAALKRSVAKSRAAISEVIAQDATAKIHPQLDLLMNASNSTFAAVNTVDFQALLKLIKQNKSGKNDLKIATKAARMLKVLDDSEPDPFTIIQLANSMKKVDDEKTPPDSAIKANSGRVLRQKFASLISTTDGGATLTDYFSNARTMTTQENAENISGENIDDSKIISNLSTVSFGKCIANFVASPLLSTGQYSEVQLYFYPLNLKSGGARKYTTASLPVPIASLESLLETKNEKGKVEAIADEKLGSITTSGFFNSLVSIVAMDDYEFYGLGSLNDASKKTTLKSINKSIKKLKEKSAAMKNYFAKNPQQEEEYKKNSKARKKIESAAASLYVSEDFQSKRLDLLKTIYESDGLAAQDVNEFVKPVITMHTEVLSAIRTSESAETGNSVLDKLSSLAKLGGEPDADGYHPDSRILRIHIYDERCTPNPVADLVSQVLSDPAGAKELSEGQATPEEVANGLATMSDSALKDFIKRNYTTITYGAVNSTIKSINVTSNTSDTIAQGKMMTIEKRNRGKSTTKSVNSNSDHVIIVPSSIDIQMLGCPFIARGTSIFLDMGTNTDLDNIYTVNSVTHTISPGDFTTSLGLTMAHQGAVRNVRRDLINKIKQMT